MAKKYGEYDQKEYDIVKKTVYAEARGEPLKGQKWVVWVIRNRADANKSYWGGDRLDEVCKHPRQFECWDGKSDIPIHEKEAYDSIDKWLPDVLKTDKSQDPTDGSDHYHNPSTPGEWEKSEEWRKNCVETEKIGKHQFYRSKK